VGALRRRRRRSRRELKQAPAPGPRLFVVAGGPAMAYVAAVPRLIYIADACLAMATEEKFLEGCEIFVFEYIYILPSCTSSGYLAPISVLPFTIFSFTFWSIVHGFE
jgi:hypothetical protein